MKFRRIYEAGLYGLDFRGKVLNGKDFRDFEYIEDRSLQFANFNGAKLRNTKFQSVNLRGAKFEGADLYNAKFTSANLHEVSFGGASVQRTDFRSCIDIEIADFYGAKYDDKTKLPQGFNPDEKGMIYELYESQKSARSKIQTDKKRAILPLPEIQDIIEYSEQIKKVVKEIEKSISKRQGRAKQKYFRENLLQNYNFRCVISKCSLTHVLEAAHIKPYFICNSYEKTDLNNGIILRADLHILFDLNLIKINPYNRVIEIDPSVENSQYKLNNTKSMKLEFPKEFLEPRFDFLEWRYEKYEDEIGKLIRERLAHNT